MLALLLCLCYDAYHLLIMPPKLPCQTSNPPCPRKSLFGYVTALLSPSYSVASCRWRLQFVPCGISGKMTIPSKSLLSLLASCSLYCYAYVAIPTTCYIMPPMLPCQASTPPFLANRCLAMLPLCSAPLIALLVAGEDGVCSLLEHGYCWDIIIISCLL